MRLDKYSNPVFNEQDLFDALYKGQTLSSDLFVEKTPDVEQLEQQLEYTFQMPYPDTLDIDLEGYDQAHQSNWQIPNEYKTMDIEEWILEQCPPWDPNYTRTREELEAYKARNMLDLLRWLKYFVDTCSKEGVVWGLGRGSSVASYVLFLIGVHSIDSIKYNLDWREFLR
jgi:DNA polymerase III alpha subunit